jgi:DNA-binding transcriptional regulator YiaG
VTPSEFTEIRKQLGLSKTALARHLNLDRKRVYDIENGAAVRGVPGPAAVAMHAFASGWRMHGVKFPCDRKGKK